VARRPGQWSKVINDAFIKKLLQEPVRRRADRVEDGTIDTLLKTADLKGGQ
jgi:hypothetical protein